jgi:flagellar basal body-associated protein FliL
MSPAEVEKAPQPSQSSQIVMILMVLLLVLGLGALYFMMTGSLL